MDDDRKEKLLSLARQHRKHLLIGGGGLAVLLSWPLLFGGHDSARPQTTAPVAATARVAEGWVCQAVKRNDADLSDATGLVRASWVTSSDAQRVTDGLDFMQAAHMPVAENGVKCSGYMTVAETSPVILYAQLNPAPNAYELARQGRRTQVCHTSVAVDGGKPVIAQSVTLPLTSTDPTLVSSGPLTMPGRHLVERWTACAVGETNKDGAITTPDEQAELSGIVQRSGNDTTEKAPASFLGTETSLWIGDGNATARRLVRGAEVNHNADTAPHAQPGVPVVPLVGSGAVESGKQLGYRVDLVGYADDWTHDLPNSRAMATYYSSADKQGRFASKDWLTDPTAPGGPFIVEPHGTWWSARDGVAKFALAVASKTNRTLLPKKALDCYGHLELDGVTVVDGPVTIDFGGTGWLDGAIQTTRGEHVISGRFACDANRYDRQSFNLDAAGMFDAGEGVTWQILDAPPGEDQYRQQARDEVYQR